MFLCTFVSKIYFYIFTLIMLRRIIHIIFHSPKVTHIIRIKKQTVNKKSIPVFLLVRLVDGENDEPVFNFYMNSIFPYITPVIYPVKFGEKYVENKTKQMWVKGPVDDKGFFTLRNPHTGKLLTGKENKSLIVKPGVHFNNRTKHFDFSGALPRGTKVGQILSKGALHNSLMCKHTELNQPKRETIKKTSGWTLARTLARMLGRRVRRADGRLHGRPLARSYGRAGRRPVGPVKIGGFPGPERLLIRTSHWFQYRFLEAVGVSGRLPAEIWATGKICS